ncbi:hypothetical protein B0H15DRAFT_1027029 [Mycena belliarum]|uniref:Uncharacterized protein n=1 Tax=Mycena belliarum TaxID=1033014 RepID=A0AAD6TUB8_9AGAR|nr:hypothetical protein B0H15DRAFT_1027029 [Mycena belliae]
MEHTLSEESSSTSDPVDWLVCTREFARDTDLDGRGGVLQKDAQERTTLSTPEFEEASGRRVRAGCRLSQTPSRRSSNRRGDAVDSTRAIQDECSHQWRKAKERRRLPGYHRPGACFFPRRRFSYLVVSPSDATTLVRRAAESARSPPFSPLPAAVSAARRQLRFRTAYAQPSLSYRLPVRRPPTSNAASPPERTLLTRPTNASSRSRSPPYSPPRLPFRPSCLAPALVPHFAPALSLVAEAPTSSLESPANPRVAVLARLLSGAVSARALHHECCLCPHAQWFVLEPFALFQAHPVATDEWSRTAIIRADGTLQATLKTSMIRSSRVTEQDITQIPGARLNCVQIPILFWVRALTFSPPSSLPFTSPAPQSIVTPNPHDYHAYPFIPTRRRPFTWQDVGSDSPGGPTVAEPFLEDVC